MSGVKVVSPFDRILYLKTLPQIASLSSGQVTRLAYEAEEVHFGPQDVLFSPEDARLSFYILAEGQARVERGDGSSFVAGPGDMIGFIAMLAGGTDARGVAENEVVALRLTQARILEMLEEDFDALQNTIRNLARIHLQLLERTIGGSQRAPWPRAIPLPADRDLDLLERLLLIRQGDLFQALGLEAVVLMATSMQLKRWPAGSVLWEPGERSGALYLIVQGGVEAQLANGESFEAGLGYPLGNIESLAQKPRWYRAVARSEVATFRADHETFFDVMEDDFEVAEAFMQAMAKGILAAVDQLAARGEKLEVLAPS